MTVSITMLCHYAECHILFIVMFNVVMMSVVILIVVAPPRPVSEAGNLTLKDKIRCLLDLNFNLKNLTRLEFLQA
jgi:hypothetical protein